METWGGLLAQPQTLWFSSHHEAKRLDPLPQPLYDHEKYPVPLPNSSL